jgi:hypothetical protein
MGQGEGGASAPATLGLWMVRANMSNQTCSSIPSTSQICNRLLPSHSKETRPERKRIKTHPSNLPQEPQTTKEPSFRRRGYKGRGQEARMPDFKFRNGSLFRGVRGLVERKARGPGKQKCKNWTSEGGPLWFCWNHARQAPTRERICSRVAGHLVALAGGQGGNVVHILTLWVRCCFPSPTHMPRR